MGYPGRYGFSRFDRYARIRTALESGCFVHARRRTRALLRVSCSFLFSFWTAPERTEGNKETAIFRFLLMPVSDVRFYPRH